MEARVTSLEDAVAFIPGDLVQHWPECIEFIKKLREEVKAAEIKAEEFNFPTHPHVRPSAAKTDPVTRFNLRARGVPIEVTTTAGKRVIRA